MKFAGRERIKHHLNLVPLINIVFLLLIFFMLSSTLVTPDKFDIDLPESISGRGHESLPITVLIGHDGALAVNNRAVSIGDLAQALAAAIAAGAEPELMVKADAVASTAEVVAVLRRAQSAGIDRVALATRTELRR